MNDATRTPSPLTALAIIDRLIDSGFVDPDRDGEAGEAIRPLLDAARQSVPSEALAEDVFDRFSTAIGLAVLAGMPPISRVEDVRISVADAQAIIGVLRLAALPNREDAAPEQQRYWDATGHAPWLGTGCDSHGGTTERHCALDGHPMSVVQEDAPAASASSPERTRGPWTFEGLTGDGWAIIGPDDEERHGDWSADGYGRAIALDREDAERIVAALNREDAPDEDRPDTPEEQRRIAETLAEHSRLAAVREDAPWTEADIPVPDLEPWEAPVVREDAPSREGLDVERLARAMDIADPSISDGDADEDHAEHLAYAKEIARGYAALAATPPGDREPNPVGVHAFVGSGVCSRGYPGGTVCGRWPDHAVHSGEESA